MIGPSSCTYTTLIKREECYSYCDCMIACVRLKRDSRKSATSKRHTLSLCNISPCRRWCNFPSWCLTFSSISTHLFDTKIRTLDCALASSSSYINVVLVILAIQASLKLTTFDVRSRWSSNAYKIFKIKLLCCLLSCTNKDICLKFSRSVSLSSLFSDLHKAFFTLLTILSNCRFEMRQSDSTSAQLV